MNTHQYDEQSSLILAAEECDPDTFSRLHRFSGFEQKVIRGLVAHGPVLLRGGRGSGKSALLIEADRTITETGLAFSIYISLRYLPLLRSSGHEYEEIFCSLLVDAVRKKLGGADAAAPVETHSITNAGVLREFLSELAQRLKKRIVLIFDDAAHIGREKSLTEFFDIFRTISSSWVSCKAAIYPGVTKFGVRFDVYNDATVIDVARDERSHEFAKFFEEVLDTRFPALSARIADSRSANKTRLAAFLGRTVVGNMRAFVFACNWLAHREKFGLPDLREVLLQLSSEYYWPLLDEVAPKLGPYEPLIEPSRSLAEAVFTHAGTVGTSSTVIHRDIVQRLGKLFEILEYVGFFSKREASRAMKSGGRGPRYSLNLAYLLEVSPKAQLTQDQFNLWLDGHTDFAEIHVTSNVIDINLPVIDANADLSVFQLSVTFLAKSKIYPYGLTDLKIEVLQHAGYTTIGATAEATDDDLLALDGIGQRTIERVRAVINQAVWM